MTDFKFWYIRRDDDIHVSECAIRIYEGEVTTELEIRDNGPENVTRYRRSKRLEKKDLPHFKNNKTRKEVSGAEAIVFTSEDFGIITTDEDLTAFIMTQIQKDKARTPIPEQRWQR